MTRGEYFEIYLKLIFLPNKSNRLRDKFITQSALRRKWYSADHKLISGTFRHQMMRKVIWYFHYTNYDLHSIGHG